MDWYGTSESHSLLSLPSPHKGLLLRDVGRAGDAQRFFLQARFHAGANRAAVENIIGEQQ